MTPKIDIKDFSSVIFWRPENYCTDQQEYFEYLNRFLLLIEPIIVNLILPIYQKHLTEADLLGVVAFYETPVGKKFAEKTPLVTQESMLAGQEWGKQIGQKVVDKLKDRGYLKE